MWVSFPYDTLLQQYGISSAEIILLEDLFMNSDMIVSAFLEDYDGIFEEYLSKICVEERHTNPKQAELFEKRETLLKGCPSLLAIVDREKATAISEGDSKKLIEYLLIQNRIEEGDLEAVFLRGIADGYRFFRRLGILTE